MSAWTVSRRPLELLGALLVLRLDCVRGDARVTITIEVPRGQALLGAFEVEGEAVPIGFGVDAAPWLLDALLDVEVPESLTPFASWPTVEQLDELRRDAARWRRKETSCPS